MANIRLYQFPSKASPVPADEIYGGDSASSFDEVNMTIAQLISAYPNLSSYATLTLSDNTYAYVNGSAILTAGTITTLGVSLLADSTISAMQSTLGYQSAPAASLFAGWDANKNLSANSFISGYATTATAASSTTLTVASNFQQFFTGTTTQTVLLPVTSTLVLGQSFYIVNNSTGAVTVQSSGTNNIQVMAANTTLLVTCILTSGTTAASWYADYNFQNALTLPLSIANGGTAVSSVTVSPAATAWAGWDANKNLSANNLIEAYATTATAASSTTLTVGSAAQQFFTGTTTQTVVMPVTTTLVLGQSWVIVNNSTGVVTVQSSGGNTITAMAAGTQITVTCILASGTTAASWNSSYVESGGLVLPGTSGQLAYYAANGSIVSGLTTGTGVTTALGINVGTAGAFVTNGGALGTPSSGTLTNATGLPAAGVTNTAVTKCVNGSFTFNLTTATGGTSVVNSLSFTPKVVNFMCCINGSSTVSMGADDGVAPYCVFNDDVDSTKTWGFFTNASIQAAAQSGASQKASITTIASNGFTITWTKTGSPTGTVTVMWTAIG